MKAEDQRIKAMKKCFWLPDHLTGSGAYSETWPKPLRLFSYYLSRPASSFQPTVPEIISNLRKYYPEDQVLMHFARFLEAVIKDDPDVTFTYEYKRALIPRCPDGSRSFSATQQSSELKNE
ncbi:hypothetical protein ABBQ38_011437 [Trebouxia sp. C0009 RCD-2024]